MPYTVGTTPWRGDQPVARPLPTHRTTQTQNKRTQCRHPCLELDSKPRSQSTSERKQFMPQTARPLWSANKFPKLPWITGPFAYAYVYYSMPPFSQIYASYIRFIASREFVTHRIVVSGGTSGTLSSCRNMHLTVVRKHRHLAGHWASASPVVKATRNTRKPNITTTHTEHHNTYFTARWAGRDWLAGTAS
jgi:hypothetical protein